MRKVIISLIIFLCSSVVAFSTNIIKHIDSAIHGQTYCIKGDESTEVKTFLKEHAFYAYNECQHEKTTKNQFEELEKLANKNPNKYGFYLGMAYFLGFDIKHKENNVEAAKWFIKSAKLGNENAKFRYCDTVEDAKKAFDCYNKVKTPQSLMAKASLFTNFEKQCHYIKQIDFSKYLDSYPFIISCEMNLNEDFKFDDDVKNKLKNVILNGKTTFGSKLSSADTLQDENTFKLLSKLNFQ